MSRSYKKNPCVTDHHVKSSQERKKFANKKVRNTKDIPQRSGFKKVSESRDICDFKIFYSWEDFKKFWEDTDKSEKELYRMWYTSYKRK